jgi:hypothetical protein
VRVMFSLIYALSGSQKNMRQVCEGKLGTRPRLMSMLAALFLLPQESSRNSDAHPIAP